LTQLKSKTDSPEIPVIDKAEADHQAALDRLIALRRTEPSIENVAKVFDSDVQPRFDELRQALKDFVTSEDRKLSERKQAATASADRAILSVVAMAVAAVLLAACIAFLLVRTLTRQIGAAVQHVQSSTAELQAAANQQASGIKEQAAAISEITTTISELLATSRQIAESAQRVAGIAEDTAGNARGGDETVVRAQQSLTEARRQVDIIVTHILELSKKSQQIGGILEIINELAEQTNILAINATIEAAGAGESGKRFAVVADEIRKLADRVAASTKEIRGLIEETRTAVNTTVMVTEGGSKAVETGMRQFADVATSFKHIVSLVSTTTEAAREIELSTKQQATAVEQVNGAITSVAQASRESEASASQTLQTASQLAGLSQTLSRLVHANGRG
jgi:methyl-accepting chemotaxis protein